jgi:dTMP kinase
LPQPSLTLLLDIPPAASLARKQLERDRYEKDLALLDRVRASYQRQAAQAAWQLIDGSRDKDAVTADVTSAVRTKLGLL